MGWTQGKEYAELEWPVDLLIAVKGNLQRQDNGGRNGARRRSSGTL